MRMLKFVFVRRMLRFAFLLVPIALSFAEDPVDLLEASGLTKSTLPSFNPDIIECGNQFGDLKSTAFEFKSPLSESLSVTNPTASAKILAALKDDHEPFGFSMMAKFLQFQPGTQTLLSVRSSSIVYLQIDLISTPAPRLDCSKCQTIAISIKWRGTDNRDHEVEFDERFDESNLNTLDWVYLHFSFVPRPATSDLDRPSTRIRLDLSCSETVKKSIDSSFLVSPPPNAEIAIAGMGPGENQVRGCAQAVLFRFTNYQFTEVAFDYCTTCLEDCSDFRNTLQTENTRLTKESLQKSRELHECELDHQAPAPCVTGCRLSDTERLPVGEQRKLSDCRTCVCISNGNLRCFERCKPCSVGGETFAEGDKMPSSGPCEKCTCGVNGVGQCNGTQNCGPEYCLSLGDGSVFKTNGRYCSLPPSCSNQAGVSCVDGMRGCFCPEGMVMDNEKCIASFTCPCEADGKIYSGSDFFFSGGKFCYCKSGSKECL